MPIPKFHLMAKPSGAECNLACRYCFYCEKATLYPKSTRMDNTVLEAYIRNYLGSIAAEHEVAFTWQGGEPTLLGLDFYEKAVELQKLYGEGRNITNSFQSNGLLIDENWCRFFKKHDFLVGLSLDGPAHIHDEYRRTANGSGSHKLVMHAMELLRRYGVRFNIMASVSDISAKQPLEVYEFIKEAGARFVQFTPIVERLADTGSCFRLQGLSKGRSESPLARWSVKPLEYGEFLTAVFDRWVKRDVGKMFVMNFEWALANFMRQPGASCHHITACGRALVMEHNGDIYACDHYVYPEYLLGNILRDDPHGMADKMERFGQEKLTNLSSRCRECRWLAGCWGGCPKHRFVWSGGEPQNYLCEGYKLFFSHITIYMQAIRQLIEQGKPVSQIMNATLATAGSHKQ